MAEFCLSCWNRLNGRSDPAYKYVLSKDLDLCEGCGQITHVIVKARSFPGLYRLCSAVSPRKRK